MLKPVTQYETIDTSLEYALHARMGCLILAGGQSSRLGIDIPKGTLPITLIRKKSLFQVFLEKAGAASKRAAFPLPVAIMTSPLNHQQTLDFLTVHDFFGFPRESIFFFQQSMLPLTDRNGVVLESMGPDGNGKALQHFYRAGIWEKWRSLGIECVNVIQVDNVLADPFDAKLQWYGEDVIIKCIPRVRPLEKVGVLVEEEGRIQVVEYTELPEEVRDARDAQGDLKFLLGYAGMSCFGMDFIEKCVQVELPLHRQEKIIKLQGESKEIYKYETFIFDLFPYANKIKINLYPREFVFAPLKNAEGDDNIESVQRALLERDRALFFQISGVLPPVAKIFELAPEFSYPTKQLVNKWQKQGIPPNAYVEA